MRTLLPLCALSLAGCGLDAPADGIAALEGETMGTGWSLVVELESSPLAAEEAVAVVQQALDDVDAAMSTWDPDSDLSRLQRADPGDRVSASAETLRVLELARELVHATGGAFDPTVGPLVELWGFKATSVDRAEPTDEEVEAARARLGFDAIEWDATGLRRSRPDVELDLSAIAKGYAVDLAASALVERGVADFLLEVGGEVVVRGQREGRGWRVGVDDPRPPEGMDPNDPATVLAPRPPWGVIQTSDRAIATSGSYRNLRRVGERLVAHAIDPRTGRPIDHSLVSVTVVATTCAEADALATAALVLGSDAGRELLEGRAGVEGLLLVQRSEDGNVSLEALRTSGMDALLVSTRE